MTRSMIAAAALFAGIAIAAPLAWSADAPAQSPPAGSDRQTPMMGGMRGDDMGHRGWMQGGMMHRMMQLSPQQRCEERLARRAGIVAYTVAKLNLTAEQKPLWDKVQGQLQAAADRQRQLCAGLKPRDERAQETILDRVNRREQFLSARLQAIHDVRPALEQLYQALTPEQKAIVDHPFRRG